MAPCCQSCPIPSVSDHIDLAEMCLAVQVSNVEVYYRAVSFYLEQHPDLLVDLLKVCVTGSSLSPSGLLTASDSA